MGFWVEGVFDFIFKMKGWLFVFVEGWFLGFMGVVWWSRKVFGWGGRFRVRVVLLFF